MLLHVAMAANIPSSCVKCNRTENILFCNGCKQTLCFKHAIEHRDDSEILLEDLIDQKSQFECNLSKVDDSHYLFRDIDSWKKEKIDPIKRLTKQAKQDL